MSQKQRVCAVVVTFNRNAELVSCLEALLGQSTPVTEIVVIDNASSDGTADLFADGRYGREPAIKYHRLAENAGGAGGFHEGFRRALETGSDWIWAMDDDGVPDRQCLERLIAAEGAGLFRGPVVVDKDDPEGDLLAFPGTETNDRTLCFDRLSEAAAVAVDGLLPAYISPFNGVMIHASAARRIGLPRAEFFLWGDEWDYVMRAWRLGIKPTSVLNARFWHPRNRTRTDKISFLGRELDVRTGDTPFRHYLIIRNYAYIKSRYYGVAAWIKHTGKYILHNRSTGWFKPWQVLRYSLEGLSGRMTGHRQFLARQRPSGR